MKRVLGIVAGLVMTYACGHGHQGHGHGGHHMEKRFEGAEGWAQVFDDPKRDEWQRPQAVVDALELTPAMKVADIGAGTGYFTMRIARAVPQGEVYGIDLEPDMIRYLGERAKREELTNVRPVLGTEADPRLPAEVDRVLVVDTYHHIANREAYFAALRANLRANSRVVIIDFTEESPMGPPPEHRLSQASVESEMMSAGYKLVSAPALLPNQYFLVFAVR